MLAACPGESPGYLRLHSAHAQRHVPLPSPFASRNGRNGVRGARKSIFAASRRPSRQCPRPQGTPFNRSVFRPDDLGKEPCAHRRGGRMDRHSAVFALQGWLSCESCDQSQRPAAAPGIHSSEKRIRHRPPLHRHGGEGMHTDLRGSGRFPQGRFAVLHRKGCAGARGLLAASQL